MIPSGLVDPAAILAATVGDHAIPGRRYPGHLPDELAPWHCYLPDSGHSILVTLAAHGIPDVAGTVPAPVRSVLRSGWTVSDRGFIVCDLPYDPALGLTVPGEDIEYGDVPAETKPYRYEMGKPYDPDHLAWPDGAAVWELSEQEVSLTVFRSNPTPGEVTDFLRGRHRFALLAGDHALILAHRFGEQPWSDAAWQACEQHHGTVGLPPGGRCTPLMLMVDSENGLVAAIRQTGWSAEFTAAVRAAIHRQVTHRSTAAQGAAEIDALYARFPTTAALVAAADART